MTAPSEFEGLLSIGRVSRVVKVGGFEIGMHTLNAGEYAKMMDRIGYDETSTSKKFESLQREIISASIETINGKEIPHDERSQIVGMMQVGLSNMLYEEYGSMVEEQNKVLEDAKKNSA